jgi:hypothetical protein
MLIPTLIQKKVKKMNHLPDSKINSEYMITNVWRPANAVGGTAAIIAGIFGLGLGWLALSFFGGIGLAIVIGVFAYVIATAYSAFEHYRSVADKIAIANLENEKKEKEDSY